MNEFKELLKTRKQSGKKRKKISQFILDLTYCNNLWAVSLEAQHVYTPQPYTHSLQEQRTGERSSCHWHIPKIPHHFCTTKTFSLTWISVITCYSSLKKCNLSMVSAVLF